MTQDMKTPMPTAIAGPNAAGRRYLAQLMEYAFREGWRTPDDFVRYFPAQTIMAALKPAPELRVAILAAATGIYEEILRRKTPALAAEDLRLALDEGTTTSQQLLAVFSPEDRVRYLDPQRIWDFLAEDCFWDLDRDAGEELRRAAAERMTFTLTRALQERLISLRDILDGLTYDTVADSLSPDELRTVVRHALVKGRDGIGLNEKVLLEVLPLEKLVRSVPLELIWKEVVVRRIAVPAGLADLSREEQRASLSREEQRASAPERRSAPESRTAQSRPPPLPTEFGGAPEPATVAIPSASLRDASAMQTWLPPIGGAGITEYSEDDDALTAAPPLVAPAAPGPGRDAVPHSPRSSMPPPPLPGAPQLTDDFNEPLPVHSSVTLQPARRELPAPSFEPQLDASERQRPRVTEHLRAIGRLPPRHAAMPAAVLRSIDAMYALLPSATDDIQRKSVIRQAFANENHLRVALLGLIELMDSSVDTSDPVIQEAKIEALIKILLFEEQRRKETGRHAPSSFGSPAGSMSMAAGPSSVPPSLTAAPNMGPPSATLNGAAYAAPGSSPPGTFDSAARGYQQYPRAYPSEPAPPSYNASNMALPPQVPTQRPPAALLTSPGYSVTSPPLPNLPADPASARRRTAPPPLPSSYPRS